VLGANLVQSIVPGQRPRFGSVKFADETPVLPVV
jgi:hypothetical protein